MLNEEINYRDRTLFTQAQTSALSLSGLGGEPIPLQRIAARLEKHRRPVKSVLAW